MKRLGLMFGMSLVLAGCATPSCPTNLQAWPDPSGKHINLQQCWDKHDQIRFYTTSQGSQIAPYELVKHLEVPSPASTEKFLSRANIEKWRFLLLEKTDVDADSEVDKDVPDWPLGFAINEVTSGKQAWRGKWLGMTCAACHTTQIEYQTKKIRIDGGPTMANFNQFLWDLQDALKATRDDGPNGAKFKRYARHFPQRNAEDLLKWLGDVVKEHDEWHQRNDPPTPPGPPGFATLDAFGVIFNQVIKMTDKKPAGLFPPTTDAPVSYPFLWGTSHHNQTQWNGASPALPMLRNLVQALGVFAKYDPEAGWFEEPSTIRLSNQREIQKLVDKLGPPRWPENILGTINKTMSDEGKKLFESKNCRSCHLEQKREEPLQRIKMTMTKFQDIKTDSQMLVKADHRELSDQDGQNTKPVGAAAGNAAFDIVFSLSHLRDVFAFLGEAISALFTPNKDLLPDGVLDDYKSRPLEGIWATAPYLHNGSVPNLYELLRPADKRMKTFYVGSREFDPVKVGFVTDDKSGTLLDTRVIGNSNIGNSNSGHDGVIYGGELKDEEIWQLVEYMKTL